MVNNLCDIFLKTPGRMKFSPRGLFGRIVSSFIGRWRDLLVVDVALRKTWWRMEARERCGEGCSEIVVNELMNAGSVNKMFGISAGVS